MEESSSESYINQLTLNCLVNKNQLFKLNKYRNIVNLNVGSNLINNDDDKLKLKNLFLQLLDNNPPENLPSSVTCAYENFINKSLFYLNVNKNNEEHDNNNEPNEESFEEDKKKRRKRYNDEDEMFPDDEEDYEDEDEY